MSCLRKAEEAKERKRVRREKKNIKINNLFIRQTQQKQQQQKSCDNNKSKKVAVLIYMLEKSVRPFWQQQKQQNHLCVNHKIGREERSTYG